MMKKFALLLKSGSRGFTLIEMAIALGVVGLLVAGLFQLTSESARTIQNQITAQQLQQYARAARGYLATATTVTGSSSPITTQVNSVALAQGGALDITAAVQAFRVGLPLTSPQGATYQVRVARLPAAVSGDVAVVGTPPLQPSLVIGVFLQGTATFNRAQMGSILTLTGAEGAGVYGADAADNAGTTACNETQATIRVAFGASCINASVFTGGIGALTNERPALVAFTLPSDLSANSSAPWLARQDVGNVALNTMTTNLVLGAAADITANGNTNDLTLNGGNISDVAGAVLVNDALNVTNSLSLTTAGANLVLNGGNINDGGAAVTIADPLSITGGGLSLTVGGSGITFNSGLGGGGAEPQLTPGNAGSPLGKGLTVTGNFSVTGSLTANSFVYSSDFRLKNNIKPVEKALEKLKQLHGVSFTYKKDNTEGMGVIAQDVQKVFPQLVTQGADGYGVNYMGLTGPIIEAIHELAEENKALRLRLEQLEKRQEKNHP